MPNNAGFGETGNLNAALDVLCGLAFGVLLILLGNVIRAGDDNIATID